MRVNLAIAFLLGVIGSMLAVLVFRPPQLTFADAVTAPGYVAVAGNAQPGSKDVLWLVDTKSDTPHLVVYSLDGGRLSILAARNIRYDFQLDVWPTNGMPQSPTVQEVYSATKEARDKAKLPPGGGKPGG